MCVIYPRHDSQFGRQQGVGLDHSIYVVMTDDNLFNRGDRSRHCRSRGIHKEDCWSTGTVPRPKCRARQSATSMHIRCSTSNGATLKDEIKCIATSRMADDISTSISNNSQIRHGNHSERGENESSSASKLHAVATIEFKIAGDSLPFQQGVLVPYRASS